VIGDDEYRVRCRHSFRAKGRQAPSGHIVLVLKSSIQPCIYNFVFAACSCKSGTFALRVPSFVLMLFPG
jgi:RNase P protein component